MEKSYTTPAPIPKKIVFREKGSPSFIKNNTRGTIFRRLKRYISLASSQNTLKKNQQTIQHFFHSSLKINNKTTKKNNS